MSDRKNTQETLKDLIGDTVDACKEAFDEILDRDERDRRRDRGRDRDRGWDWDRERDRDRDRDRRRDRFGNWVSALPEDTLRTVGALTQLGINPLTALGAATGASGGGAAGPLGAVGQLTSGAGNAAGQLASGAGGGGAGSPLGAVGAMEGLAAMPAQLNRLTELMASMAGTLEALQASVNALTPTPGGAKAVG
ncbi:hypothetical protein [Streptomyces sp. YIM 98790]|uniref:hypothetical protein n=1 Tax=Streptomyces sp. YIM 98790 TaxID=2689077 RepID=UPI00140C38FC|nr:hypothetical protein [Streptomyces sp. YIM 98790]